MDYEDYCLLLIRNPHSAIRNQTDACGRTRTYEVRRRLIYSQVLLLLSHTRAKNCDKKNEGGGLTLAALIRTKINSVIKQQKERAFGFDREAGPLLQFS